MRISCSEYYISYCYCTQILWRKVDVTLVLGILSCYIQHPAISGNLPAAKNLASLLDLKHRCSTPQLFTAKNRETSVG